MKKLIMVAFLIAGSHQALAATGQSVSSDQSPRGDKNFLFRLEPTWLLLKDLRLDFQFKLSDNLTLGPTVGYMKDGDGVFYGTKVANRILMDDRTDRTVLGLRGVYYFRGVENHSPMISAFGNYGKSKVTSKGNSSLTGSHVEKGEFSETVMGVTGGYQWVFGLFTVNASGGLAQYNHPRSYTETDETGAKSERQLGSPGISYTIDAGVGLIF